MDVTKILLSGGPPYLADFERLREVLDLGTTLKVPYGAGYEHFAPTDERRDVDGVSLCVFEWCMHTRIAE